MVPDPPAEPIETTEAVPPTANEEKSLHDQVIAAISEVYDPEIPVNIYELGLIYGVEIDDSTGNVNIRMTLTSPACPVAESLPLDVRRTTGSVPGVNEVEVDLTFEPPWTPDLMSDDAKLALGIA
jgi:FeS assembly SUF system protein